MQFHRMMRAILATGLFLGALPAHAGLLTVFSTEVEGTVIVFPADAVRSGRLPGPVHERDLGPLLVSELTPACRSLASGRGDRVVYEPAVRRCRSFHTLPRITRNQVSRLLASLSSEAAATAGVRVQPAPAGTALSCTCPPPDDAPQVIIRSGFEALP